MSVATLKDSMMPSAPVVSAGCVRPSATKTSGCKFAMTKLSIRQPPASTHPASTAAVTAAVSPPTSTMYLPEQMERDKRRRTLPALSIVSATRKPAAMLDSSIKPTDFSAIKLFSGAPVSDPAQNIVLQTRRVGDRRSVSSFQNDLFLVCLTHRATHRRVQNRAERVRCRFADDLSEAHAVADFHF